MSHGRKETEKALSSCASCLDGPSQRVVRVRAEFL